MKYSKSIKPISYLKAHASEIVKDVYENGKTLIITQNGEPKVAVIDIKELEKSQETMAMLRLLALSTKDIEEGKTKPIKKTFSDIRKKINELKKSEI